MEETNELREPEIDLKKTRKHFSRLGLWFFVGTIIINVSQVVLIPIRYFMPQWLTDANLSVILLQMPMYLIGMPALIAIIHTIPAQAPQKHAMKAGHFILAVIMSCGIMYIFNLLGTAITSILEMFKGGEVQDVLNSLLTGVSIPVVFVLTVICAPIMEEYVFRKLIVDRTIRYGEGVAVLMSGLMFGLFHGNLGQFVYAFALGLFFAFIYAKTGKLKITIALHMTVNFMGAVVGLIIQNMLDLEQLSAIAQSEGDIATLLAFYMENLGGMILLFAYDMFVYGSIIVGGILIVVALAKKRFWFAPAEVAIPRGKRFRTVILNLGMLLYCIFWIAVIIIQICS